MAKTLVSVCIFCFLCATHSPCASHAVATDGATPVYDNRIPFKEAKALAEASHKNNTNHTSDEPTITQLFRLYGDGENISVEGFQRIIQRLDLTKELTHKIDEYKHSHKHEHEHNHNDGGVTSCKSRHELYDNVKHALSLNSNNDSNVFMESCDALLSAAMIGRCTLTDEDADSNEMRSFDGYAWMYSLLAITIISACGIFGLLVIPVMQKRFYQPLLQFLVALAVGTLAGDALLHLLPHAMMSSDHHAGGEEHHHQHDENMWKGVVAMLGLILFFFVERLIMLVAKWRKRKQQLEKQPTRLKVIKPETSTQLTNATDKQCIHKYSSFPYCYDEIRKIDDSANVKHPLRLDDISSFAEADFERNQNHTECPDEASKANCTEVNKMLPLEHKAESKDDTDSVEYTVILREHESRHHGHSHTHGHVHAPPKSMSSVAWMVIMGDGLHNFTDGMAIGAAFASSTAGGFSTAVAVFCHELPHELGDFAMLLKAGMSMKQALYYNLLSSVLCLFGSIFGLWLGNTETASSWIFAAAAGMFLYIALVDMIPELSSGHEDEGNFVQCGLHLLGLLLGFGIMALIAMYEHDLKSIFHET